MFHILLERSGHLIEGLTQLIDLVITAQSSASRQVAVTDLLCGTGDAMNRLGEHARHERSDNDRNADCNNRGEGHGVKGLLPKRRVRLGEQSVGADGPQLYLSDMLAGRRYNLDVSNAIGVGWSRRDRAMRCPLAARVVGRSLVFAYIGGSACRGPGIVINDHALFIDDLHAQIVGNQTRRCDRAQFSRGPRAVFLI